MDGMAPIRSARRLLVTAVGPARNTGMEYEQTSEMSAKHHVPLWKIKTLGSGPVRLEAIEGSLRITSDHARQLKAWTLDVNGKRTGEVRLAIKGNSVTLAMRSSDETMYYEIGAPSR
jgi:hypothetical protein